MDWTTIENRMKEQFFSLQSQKTARHALSVSVDGQRFSDIDYTCKSRASWSALGHLVNLAALSGCYAYDRQGFCYRDETVKTLIIGGLEFWFQHDFHNPNWWYNDLGVPQQLRLIALYLHGELPQELFGRILARLQDDIEDRWTGTNRMWFAENLLFRAVLTQDEALLLKARSYLQETMAVADKPGVEGMQVDGSYAQHGMQLYNNGYGYSFLAQLTKWMYILDTDGARLDADAMAHVTQSVLQGLRFMCRYDEADPNSRSREIVRGFSPSPQHQMESRLGPLRLLYTVSRDAAVKSQLQNFMDFIQKKRTNPGKCANTMYYRLDFMTQSRDRFYASTRLLSKHTLGGDVCGPSRDDMRVVNGENVRAGFTGYGMTLCMLDGSEYHNIYPLWNWGRLPAVTSPEICLHLEQGALCDNAFAGGASHGCFGVCGFSFEKEYRHNGKKDAFGGRKAVFYFEDELYFVGDQLHTTALQPFHTTLDQCFFRGEAWADGKGILLDTPLHRPTQKIWHNQIGYILREPAEVWIEAESKTGKWSDITLESPIPANLDTASGEVFTVCLPHKNKQSAEYEYAVLPGVSRPDLEACDLKAAFHSVKTDVGYVVYHAKTQALMAVFFEAGSLELDGHTLSMDAPGFAVVSHDALCVSAPTVDGGTVNLIYNGKPYAITVGGGVFRGKTEGIQR